MPDYRLTEAADNDILQIAIYTLRTWGEAQSDRYLNGMHKLFGRLSVKPELGINCDSIRPGYVRFRYRSHIVFYRKVSSGVLIIRVLHGQMDFVRHL